MSLYSATIQIIDENREPYQKTPIKFVPTDIDKSKRVEPINWAFLDKDGYYNYNDPPDYLGVEIGMRYINQPMVGITGSISGFVVSRDIEFYSQESYIPYLRILFAKRDLVKSKGIYFRNSIEIDFHRYTKQTPFFPDSGIFPYGKSMDIGTELQEFALFWRWSLFYNALFFRVGIYIGGGVNILDGNGKYLRYLPSDTNGSNFGDSKLDFSEDGKILEVGDEVEFENSSSPIVVYGFEMDFDFEPFHVGLGVDFRITNTKNIYLFERGYVLEIGYVF